MKTAQPIRLCLFEQYDFGTNDYYISMTFQKTSTHIVYKRKKRLAKSGKDSQVFFGREVEGFAQAVTVHVDSFRGSTGQHGYFFGRQVHP